MTGSAQKMPDCNGNVPALPVIRWTGWFGVLRERAEYAVAVAIIGVLACVTLGACLLLRPIGILIERSAAKEKRRRSPNDQAER